ncbi:MAG: AbrB/MazE/SpoVT family DNA-binding domain-containing protein [Phycisphaerae bacterium]|nr:AbrB/MazE/SpoVT family DNA-binding domain-containing protein [Phycisphaerae bacterium]
MVKSLTKHGNSYALIIDKPIMELLNIAPETPLEVTTDGKSLLIRPVERTRQEKFEKLLKQTCEQYNEDLRKLAE